MSNRLITIARFPNPAEADLARSRLEVEGIPSFIANQHTHGLVLAPAETELQVPAEVAEQAVELLTTPTQTAMMGAQRGIDAEVDAVRCLICQSSAVIPESGNLGLRLLRFVLAQFIPFIEREPRRKQLRCEICGHRWKEGDLEVRAWDA